MENINIIIPLCGKGTRFHTSVYKEPKPLIPLLGKPMIKHVLDNLNININDHIFILYSHLLDQHEFKEKLLEYPNITFVKIDKETSGASETLLIGIEKIISIHNYHEKCLVIDCDTFYTSDIVNIFKTIKHNTVFYINKENEKPIYSYIKLDNNNFIEEIIEKEKISNNANTGAYGFLDIYNLRHYCHIIVHNKITFMNESYTSCVIDKMIKNKVKFIGKELDENTVYSLGTPEDVNNYLNRTYAFLFDLDGTLVITDEIYFKVWSIILATFNLHLTSKMFKENIQGNNDKFVLNSLLKNVDISLEYLSNSKDTLFIENLSKIKLIPGALEFIEKIRKLGHKSCIVTNCNRRVAHAIVDYLGIPNDFIISSDDCKLGKPSSEPYDRAIEKYQIENHKCFIFEDSNTGIISGKATNPKALIGIQTIYSEKELKNVGVDISIENYKNFSLTFLDNDNKEFYEKEKFIKNSLSNLNLKKVVIHNTKLKGGFIADIVEVDIYTSLEKISTVFKYENVNNTELSRMANKLELYKREYYFYSNISQHINVKTPKFIGTIRNNENKDIGIIIEKLPLELYDINLDLNLEPIEVSLKIIEEMAKLHSKFWNLDLSTFFTGLYSSNGDLFNPFIKDFITSKIEEFKNKWDFMISSKTCDYIIENYDNTLEDLFYSNKTLIHGDIKSPNLFYTKINKEPLFIDWQHCAIGKGVQDLIFFIIESFSIDTIKIVYPLFKSYYYKKLLENGITSYSFVDYEKDLKSAACYLPFFTAVWFGTLPYDDLIDKNFPYMFIQKLFFTINLIDKDL